MEDGSTLWNKAALFKLSLWVLIEVTKISKVLALVAKDCLGKCVL